MDDIKHVWVYAGRNFDTQEEYKKFETIVINQQENSIRWAKDHQDLCKDAPSLRICSKFHSEIDNESLICFDLIASWQVNDEDLKDTKDDNEWIENIFKVIQSDIKRMNEYLKSKSTEHQLTLHKLKGDYKNSPFMKCTIFTYSFFISIPNDL